MSAKQINFYISPNDIEEINIYLQQNKLISIARQMSTNKLQKQIPNSEGGFCYLLKAEDENKLKISKLTENLFFIDETFSPVIEFWISNYNSNILELGRGRFYYNIGYYENNKWIEKDINFCNTAKELFNWFRKNFKNQKIEEYSGFHITPSTAKLIKTGLKLN